LHVVTLRCSKAQLPALKYVQGVLILPKLEYVPAQKGLALPRALRRDRFFGLTLPAFLACDSARPICACGCHT
jgi:hypothetical protein